MVSSLRTTTFKTAAAALFAGTALTLSACAEEPEAPAPTKVEGVIDGITIDNARLVLAPVEGNPAALYFDFGFDGDRVFSLDRFSVEGAGSAVMHQFGEYDYKVQMMEAMPVPVKKGDKVEFKPGDLHVMVGDLSPEIKAGDTAEVTMKVSGGDTHKFTAQVRAAGEER